MRGLVCLFRRTACSSRDCQLCGLFSRSADSSIGNPHSLRISNFSDPAYGLHQNADSCYGGKESTGEKGYVIPGKFVAAAQPIVNTETGH